MTSPWLRLETLSATVARGARGVWLGLAGLIVAAGVPVGPTPACAASEAESPDLSLVEADQIERAMQRSYDPIDLSKFRDSIHHWQAKDGRDRNDARYADHQIVHIAENLLKFQNSDGGWPTNLDWLAQIDVEEIRRIRGNSLGHSTFDNRNTYSQIDYLGRVAERTGIDRYRRAAERGLDYLLDQQRPTGGWRGKDVDAITFNDDVMVGIMHLLLEIRRRAPHTAWIDPSRRDRSAQALERAIDVTLKCQIVVDGRKTAWCQQHDHTTFQPVAARTYELPSITAQESTGVVRFLMQLDPSTPRIVDAVDSAVAWLESSQMDGIRVVKVPIDPVRFEGHTATFDRIVIHDPAARPLWARFYELDANRPFFCNRDGKKVSQLSDVLLERRVGYAWYGYWPANLLARQYPEWKARVQPTSTPGR